MRKLSLISIFLLFVIPAFAQDEELVMVDSYRLIEKDGFSFDFTLSEKNGDEASDYTMRVHVKDTTGESAVCKYISPVKMKGRIVLVDGKKFWYLDQGMRSPIRISSRQMLFGQASAGDITRIVFYNFYSISEKTEADDLIVLKLKALPQKGAIYNSIHLYVEPETYKPVFAECFAKSGQLLKKIKYTDYGVYKGREVLTGMEISSADGNSINQIALLNFSSDKLDNRYFNKAFINRIP